MKLTKVRLPLRPQFVDFPIRQGVCCLSVFNGLNISHVLPSSETSLNWECPLEGPSTVWSGRLGTDLLVYLATYWLYVSSIWALATSAPTQCMSFFSFWYKKLHPAHVRTMHCMCVCVCVCVCMLVCVCVYVRMHASVHVCICAHECVCVCACMCA